jgi:hypothetical protein
MWFDDSGRRDRDSADQPGGLVVPNMSNEVLIKTRVGLAKARAAD